MLGLLEYAQNYASTIDKSLHLNRIYEYDFWNCSVMVGFYFCLVAYSTTSTTGG